MIGLALLAALSLALGAWLMLAINRGMVASVDAALQAAQALARGDLAHQQDVVSHDEVGQLAQAQAQAMRQLAEIVDAVTQKVSSERPGLMKTTWSASAAGLHRTSAAAISRRRSMPPFCAR